MKAICTGCGQVIELKEIPAPKLFNDPAMSVLVSNHPDLGFCFNCKTKVAVSLQNASLTYVARPVNAPSPIVLAPASALPKVQG